MSAGSGRRLRAQVDYYDTAMPGLILRVNYGGAKVFRALHYIKRLGKDGRRITIPTTTKLGRHPTLTVKEARETVPPVRSGEAAGR